MINRSFSVIEQENLDDDEFFLQQKETLHQLYKKYESLYKFYEFVHLESTQSIHYGGIILTPADIKFGYISGAGILFSQTTTEYILNHQQELDYSIIDDVAIGKLLIPKFQIDFINRIELESVPDCIIKPIKESPIFHFRCKTTNHFNTANIMNHLYKIVYGDY